MSAPIAPADSPLWKSLYSTIDDYVEARPWRLFENADIFLVQSPEDSQRYLCSVLGNGGLEFGLNAYRGEQGRRNFKEIFSGPFGGPPGRHRHFELDMLSFSLGGEGLFDKRDYAVTKILGETFPSGGRPLLRSYQPNYCPWFFTEPEIRALHLCLGQALALAEKGEETLQAIRSAGSEEFLVRCQEGGKWVSRFERIAPPGRAETPVIRIDDLSARRLRDLPGTGPGEEIDLMHLSGILEDHERPYFGLALFGIDERQQVMHYGLFPPFTDVYQGVSDSLVKSFLSRRAKPRLVLLKDSSPFSDFFERFAEQAGMACKRCDELIFLPDLFQHMDEKLMRAPSSRRGQVAPRRRKPPPSVPAIGRQAQTRCPIYGMNGVQQIMKIKDDKLSEWPASWEGVSEDVPYGQRIVTLMIPFIEELKQKGLSPKVINEHIDNLWALGGEIIGQLNYHKEDRKIQPLEMLFNSIEAGDGPMIRGFSVTQQGRFDATCRKFHRHLMGKR